MKARDLMSEVPRVHRGDALNDVVRLFVDPGVRIAAVVGDRDEAIGVMTEDNVLSALLPSYVLADEALAGVLEEAAGETLRQRLEGRTVGDVVDLSRRDRPAVRPDDTLIEVAAAMARSNDPGVLVLDEGRVLGVVTLERLFAVCLRP